MGKVTFVGGGPYDSSYLSLWAKDTLAQADCVLYDHLLDEELLSLTKGECIFVGKQAGFHSMKQAEINALLIEKAKQYEHVVRLKGGDSFVFGRGGEEALQLAQQQIPFSFIPGISSVIAATEMAGIPLTYRGVSCGFQVVSAHLQDHELGIRPNQIQNSEITQIILMGLSRITQVCEMFIDAGRDMNTPMAIISKGASPQQQVVCGTISTMPNQLRQYHLSSPALIVVGDVVKLRTKLNFYEKLPLFGKHILVTKVQKENSPLTSLLKQQGAIVEECCLGELHTLSFEVDVQNKTLVFTSRYAINTFFKHYLQQHDIRQLHTCRFLTIGEKTAQALLQYGIHVNAHAQGSHNQLLTLLKAEQKNAILYCKGKEAASLFVDEEKIEECILYENRVVMPKINEEVYDIICFSCASSVERYPTLKPSQCCLSIGPTTSSALRKRKVNNIIEASYPSYEAMLAMLLQRGEISCIEEED